MAEPVQSKVAPFDYITPFRYLFDNPNAGMNLLFACILMLIPFVGPIVLMGWYGRILRALAKNETPSVPRLDFNFFVEYLKEGLPAFVVSFLVMLPFILLSFFLIFGSIVLVPLFVSDPDQVQPFLVLSLVAIAGMGLLVLMLLLSIFSNAAMTRAYLTSDWSRSFEFGKILSYAKDTWRSVVTTWVVYLPASILLMLVGVMALYLGIYPAAVIMSVAWQHFSWQIYRRYLAEGGDVIPIKTT